MSIYSLYHSQDDGSIQCIFGQKRVPVLYISSTGLFCVSPAYTVGKVELEISARNQPISNERISFEFYEDNSRLPSSTSLLVPKVYSAQPDFVSSLVSQEIVVAGLNFENVASLRCIYGWIGDAPLVERATWLSRERIVCRTPKHVPAPVEVRVTNDGVIISKSWAMISFYADASAISVAPTHGPIIGGTRISVFGVNFLETTTCRFFGSIVTPRLQWVSPNEIICSTPSSPFGREGSVVVEVSNNNNTYTSNDVVFHYDATPELTALIPNGGPVAGGTEILLEGRLLHQSSELACRFGLRTTVSAVFVSDSLLACKSPPEPAGKVMVEISLNGLDFYFTSLSYDFFIPPTVKSLWPIMSHGLVGTTVVTIYGGNFRKKMDLACIFDSIEVRAEYVSTSSIVCLAPPHPDGSVSVHVTVNGVDIAEGSLIFSYVPEASITGIFPSRGLSSGQVLAFISGSNFVNTTAIKCKFDNVQTRATFIDAKTVACVVPRLDSLSRGGYPRQPDVASVEEIHGRRLRIAEEEHESQTALPRDVGVSVSINGLDFSGYSSVRFQYYADCDAGHYWGGLAPLPCPNGTVCYSHNPTNFTLCSPGTFQPRSGQQECLPCPVGFFCPDHGLTKPVICLAGFVCDKVGLRMPTTYCPKGHMCAKGAKTSLTDAFVERNESQDMNKEVFGNQTRGSLYRRDYETGVVTFDQTLRSWPFLSRLQPATGVYRVEHPPEILLEEGARDSNYRALQAEQPFPCPFGHWCGHGVTTLMPIPLNFSTPQRCQEGFFCPRGSTSPEGSGPCPSGYFCPTQALAVACPPGHYCPSVGNTFPRECNPGTFQPHSTQSNCTLCPTGHICPGWSRTLPELCPAGFVCQALGLSMPVLLCPPGYWCAEGTMTVDPSDPISQRPMPCPPGTFCLGGVAHNMTIPWIPAEPAGASAPQECVEGSVCREATPTTSGSGHCFEGHYCPPGTSSPIQVPLGSFSSDTSAVAPTTCFPGLYSPLHGTIECNVCPAGYSCQGYGTYEPEICKVGYYRSLADSVTCRLCPTGTYSIFNGSTDISQCLPCPEGRVCGEQGMTDLGATNACPEGHACGVGTDRSTMFERKCPAGHYCARGTIPDRQYDNACESGYFCRRGTTEKMEKRDRCKIGFFCPEGTSNDEEPETRCPYYTTSSLSYGQSDLTHCQVSTRHVCDKQNNTEYDPFNTQTYYRFLNYTVPDGLATRLQAGGDGVGEVGVVAPINPMNTSDLHEKFVLPNWENETVEVFRSCPEFVAEKGGLDVTVIGRNYRESPLAMCRFTACNYSYDFYGRRVPGICEKPGNRRRLSTRNVEVPATFISKTRLACEAPAIDFESSLHLAQEFKDSCREDEDGNLYYLQPCAEFSDRCTIRCICDDDDETDCESIEGCSSSLHELTKMYGFRPVYTLVVELSDAEKEKEEPYVRGPDWRDTDRDVLTRWNPCYSSEVSIDVTNNGKVYSSTLNSKDALRVPVSESYPNERDDKATYVVPGTWAVLTYLNTRINGVDHLGNYNTRVAAMDTNRCNHSHINEEGSFAREEGWYMLRGLESALLSFDLQHIPEEMMYYEHYRLAIFVRPSRCDNELCDATRTFLGPSEEFPCRQPIETTSWFNATTTPKNIVFNMTIFALDDVIFKVEFHIVHGLWLAAAPFFQNTATVQILTPNRARNLNQYTQNMLREQERLRDRELKKKDWTKRGKVFDREPIGRKELRRQLSPYVSFEERDTEKFYIIGVVYNDNEREAARPLNLPPRYKDYERGRVLLSFNTTKESETDVPTILSDVNEVDATWFDAVQSPYNNFTGVEIDRDIYFESFWYYENPVPSSVPGQSRVQDQVDKVFQGNDDEKFLLLPYLPFFSNCREWDSYLTFSSLVESDRCELPQESTRESEAPDVFAPEKRYRFPPLPHIDDVTAVKAPDIFTRFDSVPVADWCERKIECTYEETNFDDENPVWYQAPDGTTLFYFLKEPVSYLEYIGRKEERIGNNHDGKVEDFGGAKVVYERAINSDELIPVSVINEENKCGDRENCHPTKMVLEIGYKQRVTETWKEKQIIHAGLYFTEFSETNALDKNYTLSVSYHPLDYIDLIIYFAFEQKVFIGIFIFTGCITVFVSTILWVVVRITTMLENPPRLRLWSMLILIAAPPLSGVMLGLIPILLALILVTIMVRSVAPSQVLLAFIPGQQITIISTGIIVEDIASRLYTILGLCDEGSCLDGDMPVQWSDSVAESDAVSAARSGRLGLSFLVIGFMCWYAGCRLFLPDRSTKRELEIQKRRSKETEKKDIWHPTTWKRSNLLFCSFMVGLLCCVICEFSYWEEFGTYIWFIILGFRPIGQFLGAILDNQLRDALLSAPIMTAFDVTTTIVTLSADDFVDFILSYFIELGIGLVETVYFNPGLSAFTERMEDFKSIVKNRVVARIPTWVAGRGRVVPITTDAMMSKQEPKSTDIASTKTFVASEDDRSLASKRDGEANGEGGETVEPILDAFAGYSAGAMNLIYNIFVIELLIAYREEVQMPELYDIKNQDMLYYLLFAVIIIPFQFIADVFTLSVLELYHGWKIYDYLIYTRYRFLQRETRWKGLEDSLDECIDESVRTLDQMCFSSQYYTMMTIHVNGITMFVLGMQMILQAHYNFFGDRIAPVVVFVSYASCVFVEHFVLWLAKRIDLWRVKYESMSWHAQTQEEDEFDIPGWEDLKGASHDAYMMNQRITSETFRFKFLNYNRAWLIQQLPNILTPRTLRRSRPYLINQFTRILNQLNQDISSDSEDEIEKFGPVALSAPSRQIIRWWLAQARRRMHLREIVQPLISNARGTQCEVRESRCQI